MPSNFNTFKYAFLGTVLLIATALAAYQFLYAVPQKKCDAAGGWWSFRYRECAQPMRIVDITGRHKTAASATTASASASAAGHP
jgi:hypothetical protein